MNNIGLTDSELRIVIESLRLARNELDRMKRFYGKALPKGHYEELNQIKALLKCLELNVKCKVDKWKQQRYTTLRD